MLIFGMNLSTLCKAVKLPIVQVGAYRYKDGEAVFLYDTRAITNLLNIPENIFKTYNAWLVLPGEWSRYYTDYMVVQVNRHNLTAPVPLGKDPEIYRKTPYNDIFEFLRKAYNCPELADSITGRLYDLIYTMSRLSYFDDDLKRFLDATADKW